MRDLPNKPLACSKNPTWFINLTALFCSMINGSIVLFCLLPHTSTQWFKYGKNKKQCRMGRALWFKKIFCSVYDWDIVFLISGLKCLIWGFQQIFSSIITPKNFTLCTLSISVLLIIILGTDNNLLLLNIIYVVFIRFGDNFCMSHQVLLLFISLVIKSNSWWKLLHLPHKKNKVDQLWWFAHLISVQNNQLWSQYRSLRNSTGNIYISWLLIPHLYKLLPLTWVTLHPIKCQTSNAIFFQLY